MARGGTGTGGLSHRLTAGEGRPWAPRTTPAHGDERAQVVPWLDAVKGRTGARGRPRQRRHVLTTATGSEAKALRQQLRPRGLRAPIPTRVRKTKHNRGRPITNVVPRCQADRTVAWLQNTSRRRLVRWERRAACFDALLAMATIHLWMQRFIVG